MTAYCEDCGLPEAECICDNEQPGLYELVEEQCPQCGVLFGLEEIERQTCFACGWPDEDLYFDDDE